MIIFLLGGPYQHEGILQGPGALDAIVPWKQLGAPRILESPEGLRALETAAGHRIRSPLCIRDGFILHLGISVFRALSCKLSWSMEWSKLIQAPKIPAASMVGMQGAAPSARHTHVSWGRSRSSGSHWLCRYHFRAGEGPRWSKMCVYCRCCSTLCILTNFEIFWPGTWNTHIYINIYKNIIWFSYSILAMLYFDCTIFMFGWSDLPGAPARAKGVFTTKQLLAVA